NRVGFKRVEIKGKLEKYGFFREYTQEQLDFDSDPAMEGHVTTEMVKGANEITEDLLQIDLLNSAGTVRYPGAATSDAEVDASTEVTYDSLMRLRLDLDNARAPTKIKMITGTR
ncbi:N4-gp56 family major capsid protein, partial [Staphylococcus aureus]